MCTNVDRLLLYSPPQALIDIGSENCFAAWEALGSVFKGWGWPSRAIRPTASP